MKTEKSNLKSIKNVMSRDEMRKIMAGSGTGPGRCAEGGEVCGGPTGIDCCGPLLCYTSDLTSGQGTCH